MIEPMYKASLSRARRLAVALLSFKGASRPGLDTLPCIPVPAAGFETLQGPEAFRHRLLELIAGARVRILLSTLYLQDDDAGREILEALYAAKTSNPDLEIAVLVDLHRAQRGLIGKVRSEGNAAMYCEMAQRLGPGVPIHGVPVQTRELLGVMHLKGFVVDDQVLYSGASLNEVYLQRHERYRLDRYHLMQSRSLADSLAGLLTRTILPDPVARSFSDGPKSRRNVSREAIANFRRHLKAARYTFTPGSPKASEIGITPLLGLGRRANELNTVLLQLIDQARERLVLFTPYFNLPRPLHKAIRERLKAGCQVSIILGDKVANDFYIPPEEPFKAIGTLPYLYETNLRRFCKAQQQAIDKDLLHIHLWRDGANSFHLKGLWADGKSALLTGNNLNPRAWRLDLENGLLVHDPLGLLKPQHERELAMILSHARRLTHYRELETAEDYPAPVRRLLKRLTRPRLDRLINQML
jgi:CDP-diacylglycerol--serine O-phosphatidyltransferase